MTSSYTTAWRLAILSFAVAAFSGAFMRYGMFAGLPGGLLLGDLRHAHSHLMFFAWATPALILLATEAVRRAGGSFRAGPWCAIAAVVAGALAFTPFLLSGYRLMPIAGTDLPLSMMASGLNGAVWYVFAALYTRATWRLQRTLPLRFFDGSVALLVLSSVGALLLAAGGMSDLASPAQMDAFVDMFLTLFADGWFGLGVLAALILTVFHDTRRKASTLSSAAWLLTAGLAVRTLARLGVDALGLTALGALETAAGALAAVAWLLVVVVLLAANLNAGNAVPERTTPAEPKGVAPAAAGGSRSGDPTARKVALAVLALIGVKAVFEFVIAFPVGAAFVAREGLRILLLHAFLLGAVTLALATSMRAMLGKVAWRGLGWFASSVALTIACLVPLTGLWPAAMGGPWVLRAAFYSSLGPPLAAAVTLSLSSALASPATGPRAARSPAPEPSRPPA